ncbi:hypothetical protein PG995_008702 [Apiospora arundinis]
MESLSPYALGDADDHISLRSNDQSRHHIATAQEYAERIQAFAGGSGFKSLYSGHRFLALANFLWRPYERRATRLEYYPTKADRQDEGFPFALLVNWHEASGKRTQQLDMTKQLEAVENATRSLIILKGYPSAEWLNFLGAKFRIDPDLYQRHLRFWSESGNAISRQNIAPRLPSAQAEIVMLRITTIGVLSGSLQSTQRGTPQDVIDSVRRRTSNEMSAYISRLSSLDSPDIALGDSIVREFVMLDLNHFAIEQIISINVAPNNDGGWLSTVWSDVGRSLEEGVEGPWRPNRLRLKASEMDYLPTSIFKQRMALRSGMRHRYDNKQPIAQPQSASLLFEGYDRHIDAAQAALDPIYALSPIFKFALFSEVALLDTIESNIRREMTHSAITAQENPTMSNLLYSQQILKRHIDSLKEIIEFIESVRRKRWYQPILANPNNKGAEEITLILDDFHSAFKRAQSLCDECIQGIGLVAHNATIQESQKAFAEAKSVTKLTKLALVFVPLSFTTSAFGMNVKELGNGDAPSLWTWSILTVGIAMIVQAHFPTELILAYASIMDTQRSSPGRNPSCLGMLFELIRTRTQEDDDDSRHHGNVEDIHLFQVAGCSYAAFDGLKA